ncbi:MAG: hypothetical protein VB075_16920, partial [Petrimonas sp.]|nr:hypothetical protein [Petrimonas sp.]
MKTNLIQRLFLLSLLTGLLAVNSCTSKEKKNSVNVTQTDSTMLCVGYYWTEAEGKEFLEKQRREYTTAEDWKRRAEKIRNQILKGTGLEKFPEKCPLNPIFGDKRTYEGYQVQNVAFE